MSRCPYCGQETQRTTDWACRWCGHPLASGSYKRIDKSYRELLEERMPLPTPEPLEPEFELTLKPSLPDEGKSLEPEPEMEMSSEPEATLMPETAPPEPEVSAAKPLSPEPELLPEMAASSQEPPETEPTLTAKPKSAPIKPKSAPKKPKTPRKKAPPSTPVDSGLTMTVEQLFADYKANAVAADDRYQGQKIKITGIVDSVDKDMLGNPFVKLSSTDRNEMLRMRCTFPKESEERLAKLKAKQEVTVWGSYDGYLVNILLKDCVLVED